MLTLNCPPDLTEKLHSPDPNPTHPFKEIFHTEQSGPELNWVQGPPLLAVGRRAHQFIKNNLTAPHIIPLRLGNKSSPENKSKNYQPLRAGSCVSGVVESSDSGERVCRGPHSFPLFVCIVVEWVMTVTIGPHRQNLTGGPRSSALRVRHAESCKCTLT